MKYFWLLTITLKIILYFHFLLFCLPKLSTIVIYRALANRICNWHSSEYFTIIIMFPANMALKNNTNLKTRTKSSSFSLYWSSTSIQESKWDQLLKIIGDLNLNTSFPHAILSMIQCIISSNRIRQSLSWSVFWTSLKFFISLLRKLLCRRFLN